MKSLSITKTGKVMLAVALVIFMLVAILGLAVYSNAVATAAADTTVTTVTATMTTAPTAHSDSNTGDFVGKFFYNESTLPLADGADFTVTYGFTVSSAVYALQYSLANTGFSITDVAVGSTSIKTSGTTTDANGVVYTLTSGIGSGTTGAVSILIDGNGYTFTTISNIVVTYDLTTAPAAYNYDGENTLGIKISGKTYTNMFGASENVSSNKLEIIKRSTTSVATNVAGKTYDSAAISTVPSFTAAVSANKPSNPAISTVWKDEDGDALGAAPFNAGDYKVTVSTPATVNFEAATATSDFTIAVKPVTLYAVNKTSMHGDDLVTLTWTGDNGFYADDAVVVSASTTATKTGDTSNVGDYNITLSTSQGTQTAGYAGLANYSITYVHNQAEEKAYGTYTITRKIIDVPTVSLYNDGAALTPLVNLTAGAEAIEKNYNGKVWSFNYAAASDNAYSGVDNGGSKNAGTYTLTISVGDNYRWAANDIADKVFTYTINKIMLTVTAVANTITYGDAPAANGVTYSGFATGDDESVLGGTLAYDITYSQWDHVTDDDHSYTITPKGYTSDGYNFTYVAAALTVNKAPLTLSWTDMSKPYNGSTQKPSVAIASGLLNDDEVTISIPTAVGPNANTYTVTAVLASGETDTWENYSATLTNDTFAITKVTVTVTADDKDTIYGSAAPAFTYVMTGFVNNETEAGLRTAEALSGTVGLTTDYTATAGNPNRVAGNYAITTNVTGVTATNYVFSTVNGALAVARKVVTFTWAEATGTNNDGDFSWVYDAASHTIVASVEGAAYSEDITVDGYTGDASATDVGDYSRTVISLSDNANYAITDAGTKTEAYHITKAPVTVTITPATSLVYNSAERTVFTVTVSGMIGEETLTYTFDGTNIKEADGTFTLNDAGSQTFTGMLAKTYNLALSNPADGTGLVGNYEVTLPAAAECTIAKATFTPGAISYSGATVSWAATTGTQGSDVITFTYTVNKGATEKQSGSGLSYTASETGSDYVLAITFAGDRAANYNAIADQNLLAVFSVTLADTAYDDATYGHPHNGDQITAVTQYAFAGQTVPGVSDWEVAGYEFKGWYVDATDRDSAKFNAANAVNATATYVASWDVVKYNVTYKYKLAGASEWETYKTNVLTTYWTSLETVPTITWFGNVGWNDAEAMNGATKTILDYTSDRTYYTVYSFNVGNGDIDGNRDVSGADATMLRKYLVNTNSAYVMTVVESIEAAWAIVDQFDEGEYDFSFAENTYFLEMVADVNGNGEIEATDIFWVAASQIDDNAFGLKVVDNAVELEATVAADATALAVAAEPASVTRAGVALVKNTGYTYANGTVTLTDAIGDDTIVIKVTGYKNNVVTYTYTKKTA